MKSITVIGRRWFERTNGNTYHSANVIVDGVSIGKTQFAYGYGSHYLQTATEMLDKAGLIPDIERYKNGGQESLWRYCDRNGIAFTDDVADVQRKKDL
jgi:hypothetical protein